MRILLVTPYYAPAYHFGGAVVVGETIVTDLVARGHDVTVATTDVLDPQARIAAGTPSPPDGATVVRFPNVSNALAARMGWTPRGWRRWIGAQAGSFDVILLHDVYSVLSVAAARAAARAGVPFALQPLGSVAPSKERGRPLLKRTFLRLWGARTLGDAAALIHSTDDERADFLAAGAPAATLERLPLPLDIPPAGDTPLAAVPTLVSIGRIDPIKNLDVLLEALAIARRSIPELRLELAGPGDDGDLRAQAARLGIADAVGFHGFVSTEEKQRLLESAHAFCLLSRSEGLPIAALEALASGTPVVLSPGCHLPEIDGHAGVVAAPEPAAAGAAIVALLADEPARARMGAAARAFADDFRTDRAMAQMAALLERLAAGDGIAARAARPQRVLLLGAVNSPHLIELASAMDRRGFTVHLAGYVSASVPPADLSGTGVVLHEIPGRALRGGGLPVHVRAIRRLLRELRPDVVHAHSVSYFCWSAALAGARPLISTAWGSDVYHASRLGRLESRFALARSAWATADSPELVGRLQALGAPPERTSVIGWGVDLAAFRPPAGADERAAIRATLGLGDGPLILGPRSLKPVYNPEVLLEAFALVRRRIPGAQLLLKHLDATPPALHLPPDGVTVVGHVPYEQMAGYYRAADVCVSIPSSDSAPRSVWEAMASGTPCVLSDLPWVHSMLDAGRDALVVPIDAAAVAQAIERVLTDPALAADLGGRGRAFVEAHEDAEVHMDRMADLYRQVSAR